MPSRSFSKAHSLSTETPDDDLFHRALQVQKNIISALG
jgi:hypothetical protein